MFWIVFIIVLVVVSAALILLVRSRGGGGRGNVSGVDNHNALQNGAAKIYGQSRRPGPWG